MLILGILKMPKKNPHGRVEIEGKWYRVKKNGKPGAQLARAANTMTEAEYWATILSALRRATKFWAPKMLKLMEGKRANKSSNKRLKWEFSCEVCKKWHPQSNIEIDHIIPCGGLNGIDKVVPWITRAFVEIEGFQRLCKSCHTKKTKEEKTK